MPPSAIAVWIHRERHTVSTLIECLKRDGFVSIAPHDIDRKSKIVSLTRKGRLALERAQPAAAAIADQMMASLDEKQLAVWRA